MIGSQGPRLTNASLIPNGLLEAVARINLLDWLRDALDQPAQSLSSRRKILREVPLLVLDNLGVQRPTEWAMERLMTIINHRCENGLSLMVTTNKSIENLPGDDDGRIGSRLKRFVPGKVIVMEVPEYVTRRRNQRSAP